MQAVRYTAKAEKDLREIADYTTKVWGNRQAELYVAEMKRLCFKLTKFPALGRQYGHRGGWRRIEHESHIILYIESNGGIVVQRLLHKRQVT